MDRKEEKQKLPSFESIQAEIQNILETYDSADNDLGEYSLTLNEDQQAELDAYLEMLGTQEAEKVDGFAQFIKMSEAQQSALKAEADRLLKRARSIENTRNFLKMRYLQVMDNHGIKKVSGRTYTLSRRTTKCVQIVDESIVPSGVKREKTIVEPDKRIIMELLKDGHEVPGCQLAESVSLQVK